MMRKLKLTGMLLTILFSIFTTQAYAQHPDQNYPTHPKQMFLSETIVHELDLTEQQQRAFKATREKIKQIRSHHKDSIKSAHQNLIEAIKAQAESENPDLDQVVIARQRFREKISALRKEVLQVKLNMYAELTPEQRQLVFQSMQQHLEKLKQHRESMRANSKKQLM